MNKLEVLQKDPPPTPHVADAIEAQMLENSVKRVKFISSQFRKYDCDNTGYISHGDFFKCLRGSGWIINDDQMRDLINRYDVRKDGHYVPL